MRIVRPLVAAAAVLGTAVIGGTAVSASTTTGGASASKALVVGQRPLVPAGAADVGALAASTPMTATVALDPSDPAGLAAYATDVSTPGNAMYHQYLTPSQFTTLFGASPATIASVTSDLESGGLTTTLSSNHLSVTVNGRESQFASTFGTSFRRYHLTDGRVAFANVSAPVLPAEVGSDVQAVIGLDDLHLATADPGRISRAGASTKATSTKAKSAATTAHARLQPAVSGPLRDCPGADTDISTNQGGYTFDQIAAAYQFSGLYSSGDEGAGQTIGLYELEPNLSSDISAFQSCYGTNVPVSYVTVDGGAVDTQDPPGAGSGESVMDIDNAIAMAPSARQVVIYQGPNDNNGPYDLWSKIVSSDAADVISTSWTECESGEAFSDAAALNTLFEEATVQGQSIVAAAGDTGSQGCQTTGYEVTDPASQPLVTGIGGTTLDYNGSTRSESVWNNSLGAGSGGISTFWTMPSYQKSAPGSLGVINADSSGKPCATSGYCREVPDLSLDSDPNTGYTVYYNGGWQIEAGTSGAAPVFAALLALANASPACAGSNVGLANPALYRAATTSYNADFEDVTQGNNSTDDPPDTLFPARTGFDMASGIGTPNATALVASLCGAFSPQFIFSSPPSYGLWNTPYSYTFVASGNPRPTYSLAGGAPSFLHINATTGAVSGTPPLLTTSFRYSVVASNGVSPSATAGPFNVTVYPAKDGKGYWMTGSDGGIFNYGSAKLYGSTGADRLNKPVVGIASTPDTKGYWLVGSDGGIFNFGDAKLYGSTGADNLNKPVVGIASTPDGKGYWLVASDGGIFNFGDAKFYGSTGADTLNKPVVGIASTPDGKGYWLVGSDGGIFNFGDAGLYGSTGADTLNKPVVGMAATPDGKGYWLVASDGGIFNFGDAKLYGSTGGITLNKPVVGISSS